MLRAFTAVIALIPAVTAVSWAQGLSLSPGVSQKIGTITRSVLSSTGVPSASIAAVKDGKIAYVHAYGEAHLHPARDAEPSMRYAVGSISKQFTAAAVLLLGEDGKLQLDDPVSKFFPDLTSASAITIRMLLSHTSGYSDYWPQDYLMAGMLQPTTPQRIMEQWAKRTLDFEPGTKWEYSNTNYVIVGRIVEKVSGKPLMSLLQERIFRPLGMRSVFDVDRSRLPETDAIGYYRHALGPLRVAPKEGPGWLSAAGELCMQAEDLARWNISLIEGSVLKPSSYEAMFKEVQTKDGKGTRYGLGLAVTSRDGHLHLEHSGEVSGFVSNSTIMPDAKCSVVVLTNEDAVDAASTIANAVEPLLTGMSNEEDRALAIFTELQTGRLNRELFTENCNAYFTQQAINDFAISLKPLGEPLSFTQQRTQHRGGMTFHSFRIHFAQTDLKLTTYEMPDGRIEQYLISRAD